MENNNKKATPGKIALAVAAVVLLGAMLFGMIAVGFGADEEITAEAAETASEEATIPADGNPEDETAKGSYTADDETVRAAAGASSGRILWKLILPNVISPLTVQLSGKAGN